MDSDDTERVSYLKLMDMVVVSGLDDHEETMTYLRIHKHLGYG